jgi:integrase
MAGATSSLSRTLNLSDDESEIVTRAIEHYNKHGTSISEATHTRYARATRRLAIARQTPTTGSASKQSFYFNRAAAIYTYSRALARTESGEMAVNEPMIRQAIATLREFKADPDHRVIRQFRKADNAHRDAMRSAFTGEKTQAKRRDREKKLPADWRDQVMRKLLGTRHATAIAIIAATGCRPVEVAAGVTLKRAKVMSNGRPVDAIAITIQGGKIMKDGRFGRTGQPERTIYVNAETGGAATLVLNLALDSGVTKIDPEDDKNAYSKQLQQAVFRASREAITSKVQPSIYDFRHAFSADLKAAGRSESDAAKAMGHATDAAQYQYAGTRRGAGNSRRNKETVLRIEATNEVSVTKTREPRQNARQLTQKQGVSRG